jgi:DNA-binding phage protein
MGGGRSAVDLAGLVSTGNPSIRGLQAIAKALGTDLVRITRGLA